MALNASCRAIDRGPPRAYRGFEVILSLTLSSIPDSVCVSRNSWQALSDRFLPGSRSYDGHQCGFSLALDDGQASVQHAACARSAELISRHGISLGLAPQLSDLGAGAASHIQRRPPGNQRCS